MIGRYHTMGMVEIQRPQAAIQFVGADGNSIPATANLTALMVVLTKCDECKAIVDERDQIDHADAHMKDRGFR